MRDEVAYGDHSNILAHTTRSRHNQSHGVWDAPSCSTFDAHLIPTSSGRWGSRVSPLGVVQEPKFGIIIQGMTFAAAGGTSMYNHTDFGTKYYHAGVLLGHVSFVFRESFFCDSCTEMLSKSYRAEWMSAKPVGRFSLSLAGLWCLDTRYAMGDMVVVLWLTCDVSLGGGRVWV